MSDAALFEALSDELFGALSGKQTLELISERYPSLTVADAYAVSLGVLKKRLENGERLVGKKIGLTAKPVQEMLGIDEPDFGFLTDAMQIENGSEVLIAEHLNTPMMEAEFALVLKSDLPTSGVTPDMVLAAADYAAACFELVDTRFNTAQIKIVDTVADNASSALFVLGDKRVDPSKLDLAQVDCVVSKNGEAISNGKGEAVMGSPLISVAWLANKLGEFGVQLNSGDILLPGSLVPFAPIAPGDSFEANFGDLGSVSCSFR